LNIVRHLNYLYNYDNTMQTITAKDVRIPADVPESAKENYIKNFLSATRNTGNLMLFAGDQKIEHLNDDYYGESDFGPIPEDDNDPIHFFNIASSATIGIFIAQYGLISHYGRDFPDINYLVKLNSKSNLVKTDQREPLSRAMVDVDQVIKLEESSGLNIVGVGLTIYLGSEFEAEMFRQAAQAIHEAHQHGYIVVLWIYPRGKAVLDAMRISVETCIIEIPAEMAFLKSSSLIPEPPCNTSGTPTASRIALIRSILRFGFLALLKTP